MICSLCGREGEAYAGHVHCKECHHSFPSQRGERAKELRAARRQRALDALGGVCVRCGFSDPRALQIDHVYGGGTAEAKRIGPAGIHARVLSGKCCYQLLCANCNTIKKVENGELAYRPKGGATL